MDMRKELKKRRSIAVAIIATVIGVSVALLVAVVTLLPSITFYPIKGAFVLTIIFVAFVALATMLRFGTAAARQNPITLREALRKEFEELTTNNNRRWLYLFAMWLAVSTITSDNPGIGFIKDAQGIPSRTISQETRESADQHMNHLLWGKAKPENPSFWPDATITKVEKHIPTAWESFFSAEFLDWLETVLWYAMWIYFFIAFRDETFAFFARIFKEIGEYLAKRRQQQVTAQQAAAAAAAAATPMAQAQQPQPVEGGKGKRQQAAPSPATVIITPTPPAATVAQSSAAAFGRIAGISLALDVLTNLLIKGGHEWIDHREKHGKGFGSI